MSDTSLSERSTAAIRDALPGFSFAFDEAAMQNHVQAALFGRDCPIYTVERCTPTRPLYIPGESCVVRYQVQARNNASGEVLETIVSGRIFPNQVTCAAYMRDKLAPLAARVRSRAELAAFAAPAAMIEPLNMVVHVWPIDGELPTLVDATDHQRMIEVLSETLPQTLEQQFVIKDCQIELVNYRRRQRCVLRYSITTEATDNAEIRRLVAYGKVSAHGNVPFNKRMIDALRDRIVRQAAPRFMIPRSLGWWPDLQLSLLEALPGVEQVGPALKARLRGQSRQDALSLEEMVATCGCVAARLHTSGLQFGRARTLDDELDGLRQEIAITRQFVPEFSDRAQSWLDHIEAAAEQSEPLPLRLSHGDFKYEQVLFDGRSSGLVDFDTMCQAEQALDVGKFLAHFAVQARKMQKRAALSSSLAEELAEQFLRAYIRAAGDQLDDERQLRTRATLYETIALLRMALRSPQKFYEGRLEITTALLEERMP